ncbi:MAG: LysR family transcriptional regulator [Pseudomonadota bacterium]
MHFDFVTLRAFLMVADAENLRAASEQLNLSISAVSRRISDLEAGLGQQLFVRHSRGLEITEAGRLLMARARDTFRTLRAIEDDMQRLATGARGKVAICANGSALVNGLAQHIQSFLAQTDDIDIDLLELLTPEILDQVQRGIADIGFVSNTMRIPGGLRTLPYVSDRLVLVVPKAHPLEIKGSVSLEDFLDWQMIGVQNASSLTRLVRKVAGAASPRFAYSYMASTNEVARTMVANGLGIAILPEMFVAPYLSLLPISMVPISGDWAARDISIVLRDDAVLSGAPGAFLDWLKRHGSLDAKVK